MVPQLDRKASKSGDSEDGDCPELKEDIPLIHPDAEVNNINTHAVLPIPIAPKSPARVH